MNDIEKVDVDSIFVETRHALSLQQRMLVTKKMKYIFFLLFIYSSVSSQDLKLWYNKPATKWVEALPVGNGRIGAMIFGGVTQDRI